MQPGNATPVPSFIHTGANQLAALRDEAKESHIAEHIRAIVAVTMGNLSSQASDATRNDAQQWQQWALGVANGLEQPAAA